ncbi:DUF6493 family protein [Flavobacterium sp.]|uniref:DUF6493 family protein n=1 Tax=Flavobacterium sp. TaxID=239 RepID=UPI0025BE2BA9|nr:DUF6493 family protein [Flavobacterium sp.]
MSKHAAAVAERDCNQHKIHNVSKKHSSSSSSSSSNQTQQQIILQPNKFPKLSYFTQKILRMKKHLTFVDDTSDKFWNIETFGSQFTVTYGKSGTSGTSQTKNFESEEACLKAAGKIMNEKIKKGYSEEGQPSEIATKGKSEKEIKPAKKDVAPEYDNLIKTKNKTAILPFLNDNSKGNLEALKKAIKKNKRYWVDYVDLENDPEFKPKGKNWYWGKRGDENHEKLIVLSAIALFSKSDVLAWDEVFSMLSNPEDKETLEVLEWAKPNWINEYLLDQRRKNEWRTFPYEALRFLEDREFIAYSPDLFATSLAAMVTMSHNNVPRLKIEKLLEDATAYKRDVPQLFNYDCNIQNFVFWEDGQDERPERKTWEIVLDELLAQKKLDKNFFIEHTILIQTKDWTNNAKSFFRKRLLAQELSVEELLPFQEHIFACLHNAFPAVTAFGMDLVKKISEHPRFASDSFLDWVEPMLMRADCKTSVKTALMVFEKMAKSHPKLKKKIHLNTTEVFLIPDLNLQQRAARFLNKSASEKETELVEKLVSYSELLQGAVRSDLSKFISDQTFGSEHSAAEIYQPKTTSEKVLTERVTLPETWNDVVFLFGEFISSDEVLPMEILLNTYIVSRHLFPADQSKQLQPYYKQLENNYLGGFHLNYASVFFRQKMLDINFKFQIEDDSDEKIATLMSIKHILYAVQARIDRNSTIPMLSFPTHKPHWIEPKTLLQRLLDCQENNVAVDWVDLAVAISRMPRENVSEALPILEKINGEFKELLAYCLGLTDEIKVNAPKKSLFGKLLSKIGGETANPVAYSWAVAARTHNPNGIFPEFDNTDFANFHMVKAPFAPELKSFERFYEYKDYETKKMVRSEIWHELGFDTQPVKTVPAPLLYSLDLINQKRNYLFELGTPANVKYWNSLMPQNGDALALHLLKQSCAQTNSSGADLKAFLQLTVDPGFRMSLLAHKVLGCAFFHDSKEVRMMASEILGMLIENGSVDMEALGKHCAFLSDVRYAPFQRLSDSVAAVKDISAVHNSALQGFYDSFLSDVKYEAKLPTNFKKLVENYLDVALKNGQKPTFQAKTFFEKHKDVASLKPLIKQILD